MNNRDPKARILEPASEIKLVGGAKNHLGTRVSRRVTCSRCGCNDYISFVPGTPDNILCKPCARVVHLAYEAGETPKPEFTNYDCDQCGASFELSKNMLALLEEKKPGEIFCPSCALGFAGWQGKAKNRNAAVSEKRASGALLRRRRKA